MKKLRLEDLQVATFATTPEKREERGTVFGNDSSIEDCSNLRCTTTDTRWDCSIDFCSHDGGCGPTTVYTSQ